MLTYTIAQKDSGTGSIHDISSSLSDRTIIFAPGGKYAVVLAAFYGGKGYTTHKTAAAAAKASKKVEHYSHSIIDIHGTVYEVDERYNGATLRPR